jgi:TPR repeat protein
MSRDRIISFTSHMLIVSALALARAPAAPAVTAPKGQLQQGEGMVVQRTADHGIDIVRMPPPGGVAQPSVVATPPRPSAPPPASGLRPQERLLQVPLKISAQANEVQTGWLGVEMDSLETPLALALGLDNANGALILNVMAGGPAALAGVRLGDVVVRVDGSDVANIADLRRRVAAMAPGTETVLSVWRAANDARDFMQLLQRLAVGGDADAMYRVGRIYAAGFAVVRNDAEAARFYRMGAEAGNLNATAALAGALLEGRGTAMHQQEGLRWLKVAAAKDHLGAMIRLAHILIEGKLDAEDPPEAARLLTRAAEAGHAPSMVDIGLMYTNGTGVRADASKAAMWYRRAAELGNSTGMVNLGWAYEHGVGVEADVAAAATWYKRAADLGNAFGMVDLGLLYAQGKGVERNEVAAVALYRRAVNLGNAMGMNNLAWMLQSGKGVEHKNPEEAADLMLKALDRGNEFSRQRMTKYSSAWSREFRQALQRRLRDAGFYTGQIDGEFRPSAIASLNAYINRAR